MAGRPVPFRVMKDFSRQPKVVQFQVDGDVFRGKPFLAAQTMIDFTVKVESVDEKDPGAGFQSMRDSLQMVLMPDSFRLFQERMKEQVANDSYTEQQLKPPIEMDQVTEIIEWLMAEYGMRPTEPSSASSDGQSSPAPGMSLTASTSDAVSISVNSPSTVF